MQSSSYDQTAAPHRSCPLCDHPRAGLLKAIEQGGNLYQIVRCCNCGFVYVANPRSSTVDENLTQTTVDPQMVSRYGTPRRRHYQMRQLLEQYAPFSQHSQIDVIEVGAGYGPFARLIQHSARYRWL